MPHLHKNNNNNNNNNNVPKDYNAGMVEEDEYLIPAKYHRGQCTIYNL